MHMLYNCTEEYCTELLCAFCFFIRIYMKLVREMLELRIMGCTHKKALHRHKALDR
ncbi:hypothetical protein Plhal304r1_c008g0033771 [Plasmopara halstedii]